MRNDLAISLARKDNPEDLARLDLDAELHHLTWRRFGAVHAGIPVDEIDEKIIATNANYQVITGKVPIPYGALKSLRSHNHATPVTPRESLGPRVRLRTTRGTSPEAERTR